jgi:hypothetical protein
MSFLTSMLNELRERKLWPLALALLAGLVAVPVLLVKAQPATPVAQLPSKGVPVSGSGPVLPITVDNAPANSHLSGSGRDPFTQQKLPAATTSSASTPAGTSPSSVGSALSALAALASLGSTGSTGSTPSTGSTSTQPSSTPPSITPPGAKPNPVPAGLSPTQAYHITLSITNPAGGLDTIDPLERLSILPSEQEPLLTELGVLQGGQRVLFAVQPGAVVNGPGNCTPGPIDCEILSLAPDQTESLSMQTSSGVTSVALFAVTNIKVDDYPTAAGAAAARRNASAAGRKLLNQSSLSALSLFRYEPSLGVVVDLRNLTVGGN